MIFWIAVAVLSAAVTYAVTRPLMRDGASATGAEDADLAVYKDQLAEIDADAARGTISATEAEAARAEVSRRVLRRPDVKASPRSAPSTDPAPSIALDWLLKPVHLLTTIALPLVSVGLYMAFGAPGMPGVPLAERIAASSGGAGAEDLIAKVEARLREHPEDGKGWDVIAPVYMAQNRFNDAASAYASAIKILGETPARLQGFANARIQAENGLVPDDARKALQSIVAADPKLKEPRVWLALAKEQDGKLADAAADYRALIADAPENAPWRIALQERLSRIDGSATSAPLAGAPAPAPAPAPGAAAKGPAMGALENMSPPEREAMINRMVNGLAEKLKTNSKDKEGWQKLIRSYQMLGRNADAIKALADAKAGLTGDAQALAELDQFAKQIGVGG